MKYLDYDRKDLKNGVDERIIRVEFNGERYREYEEKLVLEMRDKMKILALDTSALVAAVAVMEDDRLLAEYMLNHRKPIPSSL